MNYIRMHQVEAEPTTRGEYNKKRGWQIPARAFERQFMYGAVLTRVLDGAE